MKRFGRKILLWAAYIPIYMLIILLAFGFIMIWVAEMLYDLLLSIESRFDKPMQEKERKNDRNG